MSVTGPLARYMNLVFWAFGIVKESTHACIRLAFRPYIVRLVQNFFDYFRINVDHPQSPERLFDRVHRIWDKLGNESLFAQRLVHSSDDVIIHTFESLLLTLMCEPSHSLEEHRLAAHRTSRCLGMPFLHACLAKGVAARKLDERLIREADWALHSYVPRLSTSQDA